jgi:hypothetical protein
MAALPPVMADVLARWRTAVTTSAPVDCYPDLDVEAVRRGVLAELAALRRWAVGIGAPTAALDLWARGVFLADAAVVRALHETWSTQIVRCVALLPTVGGMC